MNVRLKRHFVRDQGDVIVRTGWSVEEDGRHIGWVFPEGRRWLASPLYALAPGTLFPTRRDSVQWLVASCERRDPPPESAP